MEVSLGAILTAMVTPFDAHDRLDEETVARLVHHLLDHGSDGVVVSGTTGEAPTLTDEETVELARIAIGEAAGHGTVVVGVGSNDTRHAVRLAERVTALRPDALLAVNPYYSRPSRRGIVCHFAELARATDLPIVLYNIPQRTGSDMPNDLLAELAQIENIAAVKQANPANLAPIDGLRVYAGNDDLLAPVLDMGGAGGILTGSHLFGDEMRRMVEEPEHRREIDAGLQDVFRDLAIAPAACSLKAALRLTGFDVGVPRLPYVEPDEAEIEVLRAMLERHGRLAAAGRAA